MTTIHASELEHTASVGLGVEDNTCVSLAERFAHAGVRAFDNAQVERYKKSQVRRLNRKEVEKLSRKGRVFYAVDRLMVKMLADAKEPWILAWVILMVVSAVSTSIGTMFSFHYGHVVWMWLLLSMPGTLAMMLFLGLVGFATHMQGQPVMQITTWRWERTRAMYWKLFGSGVEVPEFVWATITKVQEIMVEHQRVNYDLRIDYLQSSTRDLGDPLLVLQLGGREYYLEVWGEDVEDVGGVEGVKNV